MSDERVIAKNYGKWRQLCEEAGATRFERGTVSVAATAPNHELIGAWYPMSSNGAYGEVFMSQLKHEFPDYDESTLPPIPNHWIACHWHNDVCPSWLINEPMLRFGDPQLKVFVDYPDKNDRELVSVFRYALVMDGVDDPLLETDDWDDLIQAAAWAPEWYSRYVNGFSDYFQHNFLLTINQRH